MKECQICQTQSDDDVETCGNCGEASFTETADEPSSTPKKGGKPAKKSSAKRSQDDAPDTQAETETADEPSSTPKK